MSLIFLTFCAGLLTILSPCILPVLPFVFASAQKSFVRGGLPLLLGMSITFSSLSALAIIGGEWVVQANQWGRYLALGLLTLFGSALLFPQLSEKLFSPVAALGNKFGMAPLNDGGPRFLSSFMMGVSTGLLWAPCAGPILGLVLTGAAVQKSLSTSIGLLLSYSLGASTSLALALVSGSRFLGSMKKVLGVDQVIKKVIGALVLVGVIIIAFGFDRTVLNSIAKVETAALENKLLSHFGQGMPENIAELDTKSSELPVLAAGYPEFPTSLTWKNSKALTTSELKGKVVLIDFWTYSCINCIRTLPYVKAWSEKYKDQGLVVIGVHTPEFGFEKVESNVENALKDLGITYPVVLDNDYLIWNGFHNRYWPAHYFIDKQGRLRHQHFGEGQYEESELVIQTLLAEGGTPVAQKTKLTPTLSSAPSFAITPETYLGLGKTQTLKTNPNPKEDRNIKYEKIKNLALNEWSVVGNWILGDTSIKSSGRGSKLLLKFQAQDVFVVLGSNKATDFKLLLDGKPPGPWHGEDVSEGGEGRVQSHKLYRLLNLTPELAPKPHQLEIEFKDGGAEAYSFTFG